MFGLFKNKKEIKVTQLVWKNKSAKYKGLLKYIADKESVLLLYYFNEIKTELQNEIDKYQIETNSRQKITIEQASRLLSSFTDLSASYICFAEHHPSFEKENAVLHYLQDNCNVSEVFFQVSLDEPLFQYFGADNISLLIEKMGFTEDESLENSLILRSVINAQKKLDAEVGSNAIETSTAKDWFELNTRKH